MEITLNHTEILSKGTVNIATRSKQHWAKCIERHIRVYHLLGCNEWCKTSDLDESLNGRILNIGPSSWVVGQKYEIYMHHLMEHNYNICTKFALWTWGHGVYCKFHPDCICFSEVTHHIPFTHIYHKFGKFVTNSFVLKKNILLTFISILWRVRILCFMNIVHEQCNILNSGKWNMAEINKH